MNQLAATYLAYGLAEGKGPNRNGAMADELDAVQNTTCPAPIAPKPRSAWRTVARAAHDCRQPFQQRFAAVARDQPFAGFVQP